MKRLILTITTLCMIQQVLGYTYLQIGDVRNSWWTQPASIEQAELTIEPKGLYAECGLYLDFNTDGTDFNPGDSLELQMRFNLPENAEVVDLWLWIFGVVEKADVYDIWTGTQIYEEIVQRRVDPALLTRAGGGDYMLRVFPIMTHMPRKVKITYLIPFRDLHSDQPSIPLPSSIFQQSAQEMEEIRISYIPGMDLDDPMLIENPNLKFTPVSDPDLGNILRASVTNINSYNHLSLSLSPASGEETFLGTYQNAVTGDNYYQLELIPSQLFNLTLPKKALILVDFSTEYYDKITPDQFMDELEASVRRSFEAYDSVNFIFSGYNSTFLADEWIPADPQHIDQVFATFKAEDLHSFSNLPTLLTDGIGFMNDHGGDGSIILLSNSADINSASLANDHMDHISGLLGNQEYPVFVLDLDEREKNYWNAYYVGNKIYYGNEYFYVMLGVQTSGEHIPVLAQSFYDLLNSTINKTGGFFTSFDLYTSCSGGYTYANYEMEFNSLHTYLDEPVRQVGRYIGEAPFELTVSGQLYTGAVYHTQITIAAGDIQTMDSVTQTIWAAHYLRELATDEPTNAMIQEIIRTSKAERVLTDYTAFLALEPETPPTIEDPNGGVFDGSFTATPEPVNHDTVSYELINYPNPFSGTTAIQFTLPESGPVQLAVYDITGKLQTVLVQEKLSAGTHQVTLDASDYPAGIYLYQLKHQDKIVMRNKLVVSSP